MTPPANDTARAILMREYGLPDVLTYQVYRTMPLTEAAQAHALMERRGFTGRLLLVPQYAGI